MPAVIEAHGLHKQFGNTLAVDGVDLHVEQGEIFGLVGPDGAGKTTLMRLLVTAMRAQRGSAKVLGCDIGTESADVRREIGYLSQQFSLYRDLSVRENINFFREMHLVDRREARQRIERLLDFARLTPFEHRPAGKLSGGMKQKLGLCCALIHTPKVLFLDEPTTGVDPISRRELWDLLYDLWRDGLTIFITTPYMDEAARCTQLAFMQAGSIIARGTPGQLSEQFPYQIGRITSRKARSMESAFSQFDGIVSTHQHGDVLQIISEDIESLRPAVTALLNTIDADADFRRVEPGLEDVFLHLEGASNEK